MTLLLEVKILKRQVECAENVSRRLIVLSITKNLEDVFLPDVEIHVPKRLCQQQVDEGPSSSGSKQPCFVSPGVVHSPVVTVSLLYL